MNASEPVVAGHLPFERMFALESLGNDRFRSLHNDGRSRRLFGGQLLGQALAAVLGTVDDDRSANSFQVQFRQAGMADKPIEFEVERVADGRSFSSRQVRATQDDKLILLALGSFHVSEECPEFQLPMPDVPPPEGLRSEQDMRADFILESGGTPAQANVLRHLAFEMRPTMVQNVVSPKVLPPYQNFWAKPYDDGASSSSPKLRQAMLAYLSDIMFLSTALHPHGIHWFSTPMDWASLNHSLWLHGETDFSDWILWRTEGVWTGCGRALARGSVYDRQGRLIASVTQEGLMRVKNSGGLKLG